MNRSLLVLLGIAVVLIKGGVQPGFGQQETVRGRFISSDERVTLDRTLPMKTALEILSQFSTKHENKTIVDRFESMKPISVMVNNMYWKRALEYILRSNLMKYEEKPRYFEILPLIERAAEEEDVIPYTTATREIEIHAVFFEADYQTLTESGINWSLIKDGRVSVNGNFASEVTRQITGVQIRNRVQSFDIFALLRMFETLDKGEVIANPQIKVLDGHEGKIKVGTNFFLTTRDFAGNTRFTEYESGTILTVTPTVVGGPDSTFIHLEIAAERSSVNPDAVAVTKVITESNTQVLLVNGEETAIAGLFSNSETSTRRGVPLLKDLPPWFFGLRYLFGYNSHAVVKKELVIILQASIVPTIAERIAARTAKRQVYIDKKRKEFERKVRQLRSANGGNAARNGRSTTRRRR